MGCAGVFVGVGTQLDPRIPALSYGERDARRLYAVLADSNVEQGSQIETLHLLTGALATASNVRTALAEAAESVRSGASDLFVAHFSCHGTPSGHLVMHDSALDDIENTALALGEIPAAVGQLPAGHVAITLDCCFSGTVVGLEGSPNSEAFERMIRPLREGDRFVVWAAGAEEVAYESRVLSHGLLSYALTASIDSFRATGRTTVPLSEWMTTAVENASDLAAQAGRGQSPGGHVRVGHSGTLVVPGVGTHQREFAQQEGIEPVEPDLASLGVYGFTEQEVEVLQTRLGPGGTLNQLQLDAVAPAGLLVSRSMMVRGPTSAGKTLVGELAMIHHHRVGHRSVVLLPTRALARELMTTWSAAYSALDIRVILSTGEVVDDDDLFRRNQYHVAVFTYEKFGSMLTGNPELLESVGLVIVDEVQMIGDQSRGRALEMLLFRLRRYQEGDGLPQLVLLCAQVENLRGFEDWLKLEPVGPGERPLPLREGVVEGNGRWRTRDPATGQEEIQAVAPTPPAPMRRPKRYDDGIRAHIAVSLAKDLIENGEQVILFTATKRQAMTVANWLAADVDLAPLDDLVDHLASMRTTDHHRANRALMTVARQGIAFHIGDLENDERQLIETSFRSGELRALVATSGMAMGVNSKADATIIVDNALWQGQQLGERPIDLGIYRNMAGRAGRSVPGGPQGGACYLVACNGQEAEMLWDRYLGAHTTQLESQLDGVEPEDLLIAMLLNRGEAGLQQLADDIGDTFWGQNQRRDDGWLPQLRRELDLTLLRLKDEGLVATTTGSQVALTPLGRVTATYGLECESARRVARGLNAVLQADEPVDAATLLVLSHVTTELEQVLLPPGADNGPLEWPPASRGILTERPVAYSVLVAREGLDAGTANDTVRDRLHRFAGVVSWLQGQPLGDVETLYSRDGDASKPALGRLRAAADRTSDMLTAIGAIAVVTAPDKADSIRSLLPILRGRLEVGGGGAAAALHRLRLGLKRAECLELVAAGIDSEEVLEQAMRESRHQIEGILGADITMAVERLLLDERNARRRGQDNDQLMLSFFSSITEV